MILTEPQKHICTPEARGHYPFFKNKFMITALNRAKQHYFKNNNL